jgi:ArsR family transcriptional regulator
MGVASPAGVTLEDRHVKETAHKDTPAREKTPDAGTPAEPFEPLPDWQVECLSRLFSALGDPSRLRILHALMYLGEPRVGDVAKFADVSISAVSHQLRLLRDRGLVTSRRNGRQVYYSVADDHVRSLIETGLQHAVDDCPNRPRQ